MTTHEVLHAHALVKVFGERAVVDGVELRVAAGGTTAVVGASGCGKTTLLRLIAGFERPDGGTVSIAGKLVADGRTFVPAHRRPVGYVAQDGALFPHLSVGQNIAYAVRGGLRNRDARRRVAELLAMVSLDADLLSRRPDQLSGGQQQRVALARALARSPVLMLLDEPFSALDTGLRASTRRAVVRALHDAAVTTLLVTHDQEEALSMADQIAVMRDGRFTQVGPPQEVYANPVDAVTARFLGECVFLPAVVNGSTADSVLGPIPVRPNDVSGNATLMLRPEQFVVNVAADGAPRHASGTVVAVEFLGGDVMLTVDLGGDLAPITLRQANIDPPPVDAKVGIAITGAGVVYERAPNQLPN